jgi:hypothetical protein
VTRSAFILGFALLIVAATLAATITVRNTPGKPPQQHERIAAAASENVRQRAVTASAEPATGAVRRPRTAGADPNAFCVGFPGNELAAMPPAEAAAWRTRTAAVENHARQHLDRLTTELNLSAAQRAKMFPALVRSAPGFDGRMLIGGSAAAPATAATAADEIHQTLDPTQQAMVEDQEVNRQLWWQEILGRLESDLINSTGGAAPQPAAPAIPAATEPATGDERTAPGPRDDGNLFDLLQGNP